MRRPRCLWVGAILLSMVGSEAMAQFVSPPPGAVPVNPMVKRSRKYMGSPPVRRKRRRHPRPRLLTPVPAAPTYSF